MQPLRPASPVRARLGLRRRLRQGREANRLLDGRRGAVFGSEAAYQGSPRDDVTLSA